MAPHPIPRLWVTQKASRCHPRAGKRSAVGPRCGAFIPAAGATRSCRPYGAGGFRREQRQPGAPSSSTEEPQRRLLGRWSKDLPSATENYAALRNVFFVCVLLALVKTGYLTVRHQVTLLLELSSGVGRGNGPWSLRGAVVASCTQWSREGHAQGSTPVHPSIPGFRRRGEWVLSASLDENTMTKGVILRVMPSDKPLSLAKVLRVRDIYNE